MTGTFVKESKNAKLKQRQPERGRRELQLSVEKVAQEKNGQFYLFSVIFVTLGVCKIIGFKYILAPSCPVTSFFPADCQPTKKGVLIAVIAALQLLTTNGKKRD